MVRDHSLVTSIAATVDERLRDMADPERALKERAYLKSQLTHYGTSVPATRAAVKHVRRAHPDLEHDDVVMLATVLWADAVHERRLATVEVLHAFVDLLGPTDADLLERLLREARTWALLDGLAVPVVGTLAERHPEYGEVLDRWAGDPDFWLRRAALLSLLKPLRRGSGDVERFFRYADQMLDEREFYIRKAIGWVLRDTARKQPGLVFEWLLPRSGRASGVTIREAVKHLSAEQRAAVLAARGSAQIAGLP